VSIEIPPRMRAAQEKINEWRALARMSSDIHEAIDRESTSGGPLVVKLGESEFNFAGVESIAFLGIVAGPVHDLIAARMKSCED